MCHEQWALTVIKLLRFFVLIFAVFLPDFIFLYNSGTVIQVSWKLWMFLISTPRKTRTFTVRLAVTTKYQKQFCSRGVAWTRLPKSRPNWSHRKRSYSISNIGNMMGCDHLSCVKVSPFSRRSMAFWILSNNDRPPAFNIWSHDCQCCPNLLLHTKFHHNWFTRSTSRRP